MITATLSCSRCPKTLDIAVPDGMTKMEVAEEAYYWSFFNGREVCPECTDELFRNGADKGAKTT